jgi:plastocyanin
MFSKNWIALITALAVVGTVACGGGSEEGATSAKPTADSSHSTESSTPATSAPTSSAAPGAMGSATVNGSIRFEGEVPKLRPLKMDADPGCAKKHSDEVMPEVLVLGDNSELANVYVRVSAGLAAGSYAAPAEAVTLDQDGCQYTPHVVALVAGQKFKVLNSDGLLHNVHGLGKLNPTFNRAMPAAVTEAEYQFDKEEVFKIKCDVHPWMGAWIAVSSHPFFDVTQRDGQFEIAHLPAGDYTIEAWHERLGTKSAQVNLVDGGSAQTDFVFAVN